MRQWFESLAPRERLVVGAGGVLALLIIVWGLVLKPLGDGTQELRSAVEEKSTLVIDLNRAAALDPTSRPTASGGDESLVLLVDQTARPQGLATRFTRTRPDGPDGISVSFTEAPFHLLVAWLVDLERNYGVSVESASFTGAREQGLVNGQVFLRRS